MNEFFELYIENNLKDFDKTIENKIKVTYRFVYEGQVKEDFISKRINKYKKEFEKKLRSDLDNFGSIEKYEESNDRERDGRSTGVFNANLVGTGWVLEDCFIEIMNKKDIRIELSSNDKTRDYSQKASTNPDFRAYYKMYEYQISNGDVIKLKNDKKSGLVRTNGYLLNQHKNGFHIISLEHILNITNIVKKEVLYSSDTDKKNNKSGWEIPFKLINKYSIENNVKLEYTKEELIKYFLKEKNNKEENYDMFLKQMIQELQDKRIEEIKKERNTIDKKGNLLF